MNQRHFDESKHLLLIVNPFLPRCAISAQFDFATIYGRVEVDAYHWKPNRIPPHDVGKGSPAWFDPIRLGRLVMVVILSRPYWRPYWS